MHVFTKKKGYHFCQDNVTRPEAFVRLHLPEEKQRPFTEYVDQRLTRWSEWTHGSQHTLSFSVARTSSFLQNQKVWGQVLESCRAIKHKTLDPYYGSHLAVTWLFLWSGPSVAWSQHIGCAPWQTWGWCLSPAWDEPNKALDCARTLNMINYLTEKQHLSIPYRWQ